MQKILLLLSHTLLFLSLPLRAKDSVFVSTGVIEFKDTLLQVGTIDEQGGLITKRFEFTNLGPEWFLMESVEASCACMIASFSEDSIAPGSKGFIDVSIDPFNRSGLFVGQIKVVGNTLKVPQRLYIKGFVQGGRVKNKSITHPTKGFTIGNVWIQKNYVDFGSISTKDILSKEILVYNHGSKALQLMSHSGLPIYVKVTLSPSKIESAAYAHLKISIHPKAINKLGYWSESISISMDDASAPITIVLAASIKEYFPPLTPETAATAPKISLEATLIDFGSILQDQPVTKTVRITNTGMSDLQIRQFSTSCLCIEVDYDKSLIKPGGFIEVIIIYDTSNRLGEEFKYIKIFSNDPLQPETLVQLKSKIVEQLPPSPTQGQ
ncbi:MAG: DUF1573 domain-containing protein [Cytophagaceae bacterium]|jgi:hypothetical protein|nr:DUF1573 domain-containing protein [Cytophagaceae bacterium]